MVSDHHWPYTFNLVFQEGVSTNDDYINNVWFMYYFWTCCRNDTDPERKIK